MFHDFSCRVRTHQVAALESQNQTDNAIANSTRIITEALVGKKGLIIRRLPVKVLWERAVLEKVKI